MKDPTYADVWNALCTLINQELEVNVHGERFLMYLYAAEMTPPPAKAEIQYQGNQAAFGRFKIKLEITEKLK